MKIKTNNFISNNFFILSLLSTIFLEFSLALSDEHKIKKKESVIILHGMGRTKGSMSKLAKYLSQKGFNTVNYGYPSTSESIENIAKLYIPKAISKCKKENSNKIHFVTHSLGGIAVRQYLQKKSLPKGSRLVMLSPPNKGSEVADFLKRFFLYKYFTGPAGQELGTDFKSIPKNLKPIDIEVGVITGNKSFNPFFSAILPGEDDGKVTVESAKLKEMTDFLVVDCTHTFIMRNSDVLKQVYNFLVNGKFNI